MFEAKSYNDVRNTISGANVVLAIAFLIPFYLWVLTPAHKLAFDNTLRQLQLNPLVGSLVTIAVVAAVWGYLTTALFRLHDRLYEPHLVSWRASYDADFILRSLCFGYSSLISSQLFEIAFTDEEKRDSFMQRLFYKFIGDSKEPHEELRERFYTVIRNYWLFVLAELYCIGFLAATTSYWYAAAPSKPYGLLLVVLLLSLFLRFWSNRYLPSIRPITSEQVSVILQEHRNEFEKALSAVGTDFHLKP